MSISTTCLSRGIILPPLILYPTPFKILNFQNIVNIYQLNFTLLPNFSLFLIYQNKTFGSNFEISDTQVFTFLKIHAFIPKIWKILVENTRNFKISNIQYHQFQNFRKKKKQQLSKICKFRVYRKF